MRMIIKEIDISGEKFRLMLTEQIISQVNNLKTLYSAAYDDPESFEQVSAEISFIIIRMFFIFYPLILFL